ncbi:MAG TPA: amidohydrolase family protein [Fimbriiglobus sp.]|nr:amidohydrolase family protein [Fimbriiglobus sp.]
MSEPRTVTARWVFPICGPPLEGGTVTVRGDHIEAVGPHGTRTADEDLGNVALIPGLVNAHTHLDLSGARGLIPPTDPDHFTDWLRGVIAYRRSRTPEQTQEDIREGLAECLRSGTTLIGDITVGGTNWPMLHDAPIRVVAFWELIGLNPSRFEAALFEWCDKTGVDWGADPVGVCYPSMPTFRWGASPHAPYSANCDLALMMWGGNAAGAIHLAESPAELELIERRTGPFVSFLQDLGVWHPEAIATRTTDFLHVDTPFRVPRLYIHCNYLRSDIAFLPNQSVIYCPRTHAAFGHPPHPFREFLARGVRVGLGTDSLASNPDLDILAEAKFVRERYPDFPADALLKMVTLSGAEALGWADEAGSLEPGKSADLVALPLSDRDAADPHELLFASTGERHTMFRGQWR